MLNPYEHDDAEQLTESVETIVEPVRALIARAGDHDVEIIYVNDNYGDWNSSSEELARRALDGARPDLVEPILPPADADFVIKARRTYSALDAYVRHLEVMVAPDGVACIHEDLAEAALKMMERNMSAELTPCADVRLSAGS